MSLTCDLDRLICHFCFGKNIIALPPHRIVSAKSLNLPIVVVDSGSIVVVGSSVVADSDVDSSTKVIKVLFTKIWMYSLDKKGSSCYSISPIEIGLLYSKIKSIALIYNK